MKLIAIALTAAALATAVFAQVPVDTGIWVIESRMTLGEIYRAPGPSDATIYTEHWILRPGYVYPGPKSMTTLTLQPMPATDYKSEDDFFRRASFPEGSKYVRVTAEEFDSLPAVQ